MAMITTTLIKLVIAPIIPDLIALLHVSFGLHFNFPAQNAPENSPNLDVSILPKAIASW